MFLFDEDFGLLLYVFIGKVIINEDIQPIIDVCAYFY